VDVAWTPLIIALGALLIGAALQTLGTFVNDHFAAKREERRAVREAHERREKWDREKQAQREQEQQQEQLRRRQEVSQTSKSFVAATSFPVPLVRGDSKAERLTALNECYTDLQLSVVLQDMPNLRNAAEELYYAARAALDAELLPEHAPRFHMGPRARAVLDIDDNLLNENDADIATERLQEHLEEKRVSFWEFLAQEVSREG